MSEIVRPYRIEVPEIPTQDVDDERVFDFVHGIFKLNGCLDTPNGNTIDDSFFRYRPGDYQEKVFHVTKFLVAQAQKPTLVLTATLKRESELKFNQDRDRARASSHGYEDIGRLGFERYEVSTIPTAPGIQEGFSYCSNKRALFWQYLW